MLWNTYICGRFLTRVGRLMVFSKMRKVAMVKVEIRREYDLKNAMKTPRSSVLVSSINYG